MTEKLLGYDDYSTTYENIGGYYTCVYCGESNLVIDDWFGDNGEYCGTRYYCTCEQAKIEQEMKKELELISNKYVEKLKYNDSFLKKEKFKHHLEELIRYNFEIEKEELLNIAESIYDELKAEYELYEQCSEED